MMAESTQGGHRDTPRSPIRKHSLAHVGFSRGRHPPQPRRGGGHGWGPAHPTSTPGTARPGDISVQSPRHHPATSPTQGGSSSPSEHPTKPVVSSLPPPSTRHLHRPCPSSNVSEGLLGHPWSPWQDMGRGDRASPPQSLNSWGRGAAGSRPLTSCGTNPAERGVRSISRLGNLPSPSLNPFPGAGQ